jgi:endonuclease/exonuclease/phosphatase family metal-dependent hydrolase
MRVRFSHLLLCLLTGLFVIPVYAQTEIPAESCSHPVRIATWNMENLTVNRVEDEMMLDALAKTWIALDADVVAVQEIGAEKSMDILLAHIEEISGQTYAYSLAHWPGDRQQLGFAWKTATIQPQSEPERIDSVRLRNLRPAYAQDFLFDDGTGGSYDFTMVTLHLKATMEEGSRHIRTAQSSLLAEWLAARPDDADPDVIVLGDFNDFIDSEGLAPLTDILYFTDSDLPAGAYTYIGEDLDSLIDHIALTPDAGAWDEFCSASVFDPAAVDLTEGEFETLASDHLPVIGVFSATPEKSEN